MNLVNRYRRMVGRFTDQWDTDSGVTHASEGDGYTLCGWRIGTIREGWEVSRYSFRTSGVSCGHCTKKLAKMERVY